MRSTDPKSWCLTFCFSRKFSKQWNSKLEKDWGYKDYGGITGPFFYDGGWKRPGFETDWRSILTCPLQVHKMHEQQEED